MMIHTHPRFILFVGLATCMLAAHAGLAQITQATYLQQVEKQHPGLQTLRKERNHAQSAARTGLTPLNPQVNYKYMPQADGSGLKQSYSVQQSLEFPTVYAQKKQVADLQASSWDWRYQQYRQEVLWNAQQQYIRFTYLQKLEALLRTRLQRAQLIDTLWQKRVAEGDASRIEWNKVQLEVQLLQNRLAQVGIQQHALQTDMEWASGQTITLSGDYAPVPALSQASLLELWNKQSPDIRWAQQQRQLAKKRTQLAQSQWMPALHLGFESEGEGGNRFHGPTAGISIPLWQDKNTVQAARAREEFARARQQETRSQVLNKVERLSASARQSEQALNRMRQQLALDEQANLLQQALESGEISLLEYFNQLEVFYDVQEQLLQMEKDYHLQVGALYRVML